MAFMGSRPAARRNELKRVLSWQRFKERKTVEATERNEVKGLGFLESLQAVGYGGVIVTRL
jgi:hypothetical protein